MTTATRDTQLDLRIEMAMEIERRLASYETQIHNQRIRIDELFAKFTIYPNKVAADDLRDAMHRLVDLEDEEVKLYETANPSRADKS